MPLRSAQLTTEPISAEEFADAMQQIDTLLARAWFHRALSATAPDNRRHETRTRVLFAEVRDILTDLETRPVFLPPPPSESDTTGSRRSR